MTSRRPKFDKQRQEAYLALLREGVGRCAAARKVGVHRSTVNNKMNKDPKFLAAVNEAEMEACEVIEMALFAAAKKGNVTAQQVILYNRMPEKWKDRRNVVVRDYERDKSALAEMREELKKAREAAKKVSEDDLARAT